MATAIDLLRGILNGFRALNSKGVYSSNAAKTDLLRQILLEVQAPATLHPDTVDYLSRVALAGGSVSSANQLALDTAIRSIYTNNLRGGATNFLKYWLCVNLTESFTGCLVPVYDDGVGNAVNNNFVAGDWSATLGLTGNGSTKYLASNWNPTTQLGTFSLAGRYDAHFSCWITNLITPSGLAHDPRLLGYDSGSATNSDTFQIFLNQTTPNNFTPYLTTNLGETNVSPTAQFLLVNRFGTGAASGRFLNNNSLLRVAGDPSSFTNHAGSPFFFALNRSGSPSRRSNSSISNFTLGYGLPSSQETALYNILNTLRLALGV
jgi:hypothetical protein